MAIQSKMWILNTCQEIQHPWTDKCTNAVAGLLLSSTPYCLKVYTMVYMLSMLMRHKVPTKRDLHKMVLGILQSTAFLVTNAYTFTLFACLIRNLLGGFHISTVAFIPSVLSSFSAIVVERPKRRSLLALYVANVATETLWNMAEARGWVKSIPNGQALIFGSSISVLLYMYRLGLHQSNTCKDSMFDILRIFVGKTEEGPLKSLQTTSEESANQSRSPINLSSISGLVQIYSKFLRAIKGRHQCCPHQVSCLHYVLMGGLRPLLGGISLQVALKILLNIKNIIQMKIKWHKNMFTTKTLNLGLFMGCFSLLYKATSCTLRHSFNFDDARFAIPAGLLSSISFIFYPDITVALYVMWKMLQTIYNVGIEKKYVPYMPGFTMILYTLCTATLFHAGIVEPRTLRESYFKFLQAISGERFCKFQLGPLDAFGYDTGRATEEVRHRLRIINKSPLPKWSLADW
uniref:Transmembrane protein 135 N-terminal domain-containing protein n=1 Tax=Glossina palpalis gambiensis TaxID=67801 RepID=A0A1B0BTF8_9MUSC